MSNMPQFIKIYNLIRKLIELELGVRFNNILLDIYEQCTVCLFNYIINNACLEKKWVVCVRFGNSI